MKRFITKHYPKILNFYQKFFVKKKLYFYNRIMFDLALRGMGILNYQNDKLSGEEYFLKKFFKKYKKPVILDIGANIGNYSKKCKSLDNNSQIYSFEPHPKTFEKLNICGKENSFNVFNVGIGDKIEKLTIYDYGDNDGSEHASFYKEVLNSENIKEYIVDVITVDEFIDNNSIKKINLLKIDTEGNEYKVIQGAKHIIDNELVDIIQFEFNEMNLSSKVCFKDFINILPNYNFYRLLPDGMVGISYSSIECEIFAFQNIIAVRKNLEF